MTLYVCAHCANLKQHVQCNTCRDTKADADQLLTDSVSAAHTLPVHNHAWSCLMSSSAAACWCTPSDSGPRVHSDHDAVHGRHGDGGARLQRHLPRHQAQRVVLVQPDQRDLQSRLGHTFGGTATECCRECTVEGGPCVTEIGVVHYATVWHSNLTPHLGFCLCKAQPDAAAAALHSSNTNSINTGSTSSITGKHVHVLRFRLVTHNSRLALAAQLYIG
jgi:hypothetical protein